MQTCGTKTLATTSSTQTKLQLEEQRNNTQQSSPLLSREKEKKMASTSIPIQTIQNPLISKSSSLRKTRLPLCPSPSSKTALTLSAKFDLFQIMGGRGLCNGEKGIQEELKRPNEPIQQQSPTSDNSPSPTQPTSPFADADEAFEKELLGLTGGFPGGEKGLKKFIEDNPPPKKKSAAATGEGVDITLSGSKPRAPDLPLFMPGMIVIVKNPANPFHMYCGIVQRVTDGKAGVLFEGGNWDKLITFKLSELERREKGPPMVNPKSAIVEAIAEQSTE